MGTTDFGDTTGTKLTEMDLSEEKVLEKLNAVSTAKRLANMVRRHLDQGGTNSTDIMPCLRRNCTTRTLASARRSTS